MIPEHIRGWVYLIAVLIFAILLAVGAATGESVREALGLLAVALGLTTSGLAAANTSRSKPDILPDQE